MKPTRLLAAALLLPCCTSIVSASTIVTQYQFNPNGDWFADPPVAPVPGVGDIDLIPYTSNQTHTAVNNIYNYATTSAITSTQISGISGPGLNFVVQARNAPIDANNNSSLILRSNNGRLAIRNQAVSGGGLTEFGWSTAAPTGLTDLTYFLSIGPASGAGGIAGWEDGMRLAMQDTGGNWYLSNWTSNGKVPIGSVDPAISGTLAGLYGISLATETWAPYTPANSGSGALVTFDAGSAVFSPYLGDAQAFGFFVQQHLTDNGVVAGEFRSRMQGFQVQYIPEPGSALLLGLGTVFLARRRRRA